ncbi:hypothetical protein J2S13_002911 [Oikeobacillus pervagus]|uniref:Uncharacterized protein n=1 Tax=Oikeobacillus pervagus TaxID=1325931 RepID=A0AAJ1WHQ2_9BACI|nr:hypothetical protein [Oikeobacillus pervagus]
MFMGNVQKRMGNNQTGFVQTFIHEKKPSSANIRRSISKKWGNDHKLGEIFKNPGYKCKCSWEMFKSGWEIIKRVSYKHLSMRKSRVAQISGEVVQKNRGNDHKLMEIFKNPEYRCKCSWEMFKYGWEIIKRVSYKHLSMRKSRVAQISGEVVQKNRGNDHKLMEMFKNPEYKCKCSWEMGKTRREIIKSSSHVLFKKTSSFIICNILFIFRSFSFVIMSFKRIDDFFTGEDSE